MSRRERTNSSSRLLKKSLSARFQLMIVTAVAAARDGDGGAMMEFGRA